MKKYIRGFLPIAVVFFVAIAAGGAKVEKEGKAWLAAHSNPATINVNGIWYDKNWGNIALNQAEGARELSGRGDNWNVNGVVSGNRVYLLFSRNGGIAYSAVLTPVSDYVLEGSYSRGLMAEGAEGTKMRLTKR
jgi:hypothetical protein